MAWELGDNESLWNCRKQCNRKSLHKEKLSNYTLQRISIMISVNLGWAKRVDSTGKMRSIRKYKTRSEQTTWDIQFQVLFLKNSCSAE